VDVPILYGFNAKPMKDTLKSEAFLAVRDFLTEMGKKQVSNATISEVAWTRDEGVVALTHENGVKLVFGKNDFKSRLRNWEAFYGEVIKTKGIAGMRAIDLRFRGQIITQES
jgi:phage host-nuclease inhibitor protein Gam